MLTHQVLAREPIRYQYDPKVDTRVACSCGGRYWSTSGPGGSSAAAAARRHARDVTTPAGSWPAREQARAAATQERREAFPFAQRLSERTVSTVSGLIVRRP